MPDGNINIYIDSSFFSAVSGTQDVYTTFIAGLADNIGQRDTPVIYSAPAQVSGTLDAPVDVHITYSGSFQDGYRSTSTRYQANASMSGVAVALIDYSIPATTSGLTRTDDVLLEYLTGSTKISGSLDARTKFTAGQSYTSSTNLLSNYWIFAADTVGNDYEADYTAGGYYDPLIPGPPEDQVIISGTIDIRQYFSAGAATNSGTIQEELEVFFAGYPMEFYPSKYTYRFDLIAGTEGTEQAARWEATVISGAIIDVPFDVYSAVTASGYYNAESTCGIVDLSSYAFESELILGTMSYYNGQVICGTSGTNGYGFDIDLLSLKISNFSLDIDEYTFASGTICVDITDDMHNVATSGTYFIIDETVTSGTFTPIVDGYTRCFDSPSDFDDIIGSTTFTVHAENDNGDILEQDFYVTSGYVVEYDNRTQDYGFGNQVVVRGSAENMASCPDTGTDAYFFTTAPRIGSDLGATIVGQPWSEKNLSAEIVPTTDTIYFYGKTFRIEIRAKDFAGNVMEPFTFEFKIEDKPE